MGTVPQAGGQRRSDGAEGWPEQRPQPAAHDTLGHRWRDAGLAEQGGRQCVSGAAGWELLGEPGPQLAPPGHRAGADDPHNRIGMVCGGQAPSGAQSAPAQQLGGAGGRRHAGEGGEDVHGPRVAAVPDPVTRPLRRGPARDLRTERQAFLLRGGDQHVGHRTERVPEPQVVKRLPVEAHALTSWWPSPPTGVSADESRQECAVVTMEKP
jgi:hypothetical protein